jgi:hypothetical protein
MVNREKVNYHCVLYLLNLSSNIFTFCVLINVPLCCCSLLINKLSGCSNLKTYVLCPRDKWGAGYYGVI